MTFVSVEQIREIALELKAGGVEPNVAQIARRMRKTTGHVRWLVFNKYQGYGLEKNVMVSKKYASKKAETFALLRKSSQEIRENGCVVSPHTLSQKIGWKRRRLIEYLSDHPLLAQQLVLDTDIAAKIWNEARNILSSGEAVTRLGLAEKTGHCYSKVNTVLNANPDWIKELGVVRAPYGSGVHKKLHKTNV